ncbi:hypothetical protein MTR67_016624 [Solanum verrucosum]|uniref:NB-ARC domain-containing protein n=1 Tax=Solanum verrucosum TaxID=315347 RepID=A0AAF0QNR3_SOLVR|nr:hypothetical protein MTR67_016624 [Solanum verrucosum]
MILAGDGGSDGFGVGYLVGLASSIVSWVVLRCGGRRRPAGLEVLVWGHLVVAFCLKKKKMNGGFGLPEIGRNPGGRVVISAFFLLLWDSKITPNLRRIRAHHAFCQDPTLDLDSRPDSGDGSKSNSDLGVESQGIVVEFRFESQVLDRELGLNLNLEVRSSVGVREAWESLKRAFPDSKNGSRVIITTRKEDVAERADNKGFVYRLRFLSQEESWDLFCRKQLDVRAMVSAMERLAKEMVDKCGGFVPTGKEIMEDVAEGFLNELIRRSLIQAARTFWEKVSKCRIHDLLRDLAVKKALEVNFLDIYDPRKHSISSFCLRHSIHSQGKRYLSLDLSNFKLRSLMFLDPDFLKMGLIKFRNVFQHIYVLYLEIRVDNKSIVPDAIGSLYHLKFLRLRGIYDLPSSIGNLKILQSLLVNDYGYSCQLPCETADLINLRHLVAPYSKPLKRISKLTSLQVLKGVGCDQWKDVGPIDLVNLQ